MQVAVTDRPYKIPESVLVVIHTPALQVLVLERADRPGFWQSVTGSKETPQEGLADTACREVREETGIVIERRQQPDPDTVYSQPIQALLDWQYSIEYEIYPHWRHRYAPGVTRNREHWFSLCVPEDISVSISPREHTQFEWLPHQQAAQRCFSRSNQEAILALPDCLRSHGASL
jgi:dATP pyrophosphohydrolase